MRQRSVAALAIVIAGAFCSLLSAEEGLAQGDCSAIESDIARLACYDHLKPVKPVAGRPRNIDILDLKVEQSDLIGQQVQVSGFATIVLDTILLTPSKSTESSIGIYIDPTLLSKAAQKRLIASCTFVRRCPVTIVGEVTDSKTRAIEATTIEFR